MSYMLIQSVIKRKTTQTASNYKWLQVTTSDWEWLEKVLHNIHQSTFACIVGTSTSFHHCCKKKLEAIVLVMNNINQPLLSLAKNGWVNHYLRCTKCEVHYRVCKHVIRCMEKHVPRFLILEVLIFYYSI